jgi:hypothetical protein
MNKELIKQCLIKAYHDDARAWQVFSDLRTGVGKEIDAHRFIDLFAFKIWVYGTNTYKKYDRISYEIVLSANELRHSRKNFLKNRPAKLSSTYFYYVAPKGVIPASMLPHDAGLIEIATDAAGKFAPSIVVISPKFDYPPTWKFIASMLRTQAILFSKQRAGAGDK